jgi:hypothetical protein
VHPAVLPPCSVILALIGQTVASATLVVFVCVSHLVFAIILLAMERTLWRNSIYEAALPVAILIRMAF